MKQLRIAMLSIHSNPVGELGKSDTGGMSVYIRELARELGKRGHQVDIYTRRHNGASRQVVYLHDRVRLICLSIPNNAALSRLALYPHLNDYFQAMENFRSGEGIEYDLIHSHYWLSGLLGNRAGELWHLPHVVMLHTLAEMKNRTGVGLPEPKLRIAAEKQLVKSCHRIVAPTERERDSLVRYYGVNKQKVGVVPCGVNLALFHPIQKLTARRLLGMPPDDTILLYVGRFEPLKGVDRLLEAMTYLRDRRKLKLLIVGGDDAMAPESRFLRQKVLNSGIEDMVMFAGRIEQKNLPPYYGAADVLVMPSHYESYGLVGLEALACGCPVVSTPVGAMEKLIRKSRAGHVAGDALPQSLAAGIRSLITASNLPPADEIRESVLDYRWSNVAVAILKEYETAIRQQSFEEARLVSVKASCG